MMKASIAKYRNIAHEDSSTRHVVQTHLKVGAVNDPLEREADSIANQVMRMPENALLQRKCTACEEEGRAQRKPLANFIQKKGTEGGTVASEAVSHKINASRGKGNPMPDATKSFMESRFGADFSKVNIHTGKEAAEMSNELRAKAFTVGNDIYFNSGQYSPNSSSGKQLLAHELTHTLQQSTSLKRSPEDESDAEPSANDYRTIRMHFNGSELIVYGDGQEVLRYSGDSGRPMYLKEEHAEECGGNPMVDSYLNDRRYVGIRNHGPIPEGRYRLNPRQLQDFSGGIFSGEQGELLWEGIFGDNYTEIQGRRTHTGDWGSGRVPLTKIGRVQEGPCGNANARSAFFLHGGILAGSSGCIDIGSDFSALSSFLSNYRRSIVLTVAYDESAATRVGFFTGLFGAVAYGGTQFRHGPRLRLGTEFGDNNTSLVLSPAYEFIMQWAGGAASANLHVDIPLTNRQAFVRAGLQGGVNFRILHALYGRLMAGGFIEASDEGIDGGFEAGAGLQYDFGPVQLEAMYNVLKPFSADQRVHQAFAGIGFTF